MMQAPHAFLTSVVNDVALVARAFFFSPIFAGFFVGVALTAISTALVLARDPRLLTRVVRYDQAKAFETSASAARVENGTYTTSFSHFRSLYGSLHTLLLIALLAIICFVTVVIVLHYS